MVLETQNNEDGGDAYVNYPELAETGPAGRNDSYRLELPRFREALRDCGLKDLKMMGDKFTYSNKSRGNQSQTG